MNSNPPYDVTLAGRPVDLTNCDREPIHIPGSIQPHGCLLACDQGARQVQNVSENAAEMLGLDADPTGRSLAEVLGHDAAHDILNALARVGARPQAALIFDMMVAGRRLDVSAHRHEGHTILEFEPAAPQIGAAFSLSRTVLSRLRGLGDPDQLIEAASALIQAQLGYDRVMIYELGPDGAGKVVSEAKRDDLESFLGQYFPASDIPQQARALYLRNPIRVIGDAACVTVPIHGTAGDLLDLSHAHLRSVSPIHCEYLRNMGVAASMSVSIIIDGQLWGLIACHHYAPKVLTMAERATAELIGEFFAMQLDTLRRRRARDAERAARGTLDRLLVEASRGSDLGSALRAALPELSRLIEAEGLGLWFEGQWSTLGHAPALAEVEPLLALIEAQDRKQVIASASLATTLPDAAGLNQQVAGALVIPMSKSSRDALVFFRKETLQTLNWAGDPNKTYASGPHGDRLTPRKSFAIWKETVHKTSRPWTETELRFAEALRSAVVEVLLLNSELLSDERARAALRQRVLNDELNHRVKNILALIQSLVRQKPQENETLDGFLTGLRGRIRALATAHDQIVRDGTGGKLGDLLRGELGPYLDETDHNGRARISIQGPSVELDARAFSVMALILHEMATNAAKYGALAQATGCLTVEWRIDEQGDCLIRWTETGVPGLVAPARRGFGSNLIERSLPHDLGGRARVDFGPDGLEAEFLLPQEFLRPAIADSQPTPAWPSERSTDQAPVQGRRVLIVEDQALIAMSLEADLIDQGLQVCGIAANVAKALQMIETAPPELVILDVNLGAEDSLPVARELQDRGIPFVFATGYGLGLKLPDALTEIPIISKPYDIHEIMVKLAEAEGA